MPRECLCFLKITLSLYCFGRSSFHLVELIFEGTSIVCAFYKPNLPSLIFCSNYFYLTTVGQITADLSTDSIEYL